MRVPLRRVSGRFLGAGAAPFALSTVMGGGVLFALSTVIRTAGTASFFAASPVIGAMGFRCLCTFLGHPYGQHHR